MSKKKNYLNLDKWEINYLELIDPNEIGQYYFYFKFLIKYLNKKTKGDIIESGVFRGRSLITSALVLKFFKSNNKIWGYDTFSGFYGSENKIDKFDNFKALLNNKKIKKDHFQKIKKLKKHHFFLNKKKANIFNLSTSKNFSQTSFEYVKKKSQYLKCNNKIRLVKGRFKDTFFKKKNIPEKIFCGLIDCDLYEGYKLSLNTFYPKLIYKGKLFLDEYYSLKFPGPRIAVNKFLKEHKDCKLILEGISDGFERWSIEKN